MKSEILQNLEKEIFHCKKCPRLCVVNPFSMPHIFYSSLEDIKIFAIGRNPGIENTIPSMSDDKFMEFYKEKFYECRLGKYLRNNLGESIVKTKLFFTNICKCSSPLNSRVTDIERQNCKNYLDKQIEIINPKIIITFGAEALTYFGIFRLSEKFAKYMKVGNRGIIPLYHPSYLSYCEDTNIIIKQRAVLKKLGEIL